MKGFQAKKEESIHSIRNSAKMNRLMKANLILANPWVSLSMVLLFSFGVIGVIKYCFYILAQVLGSLRSSNIFSGKFRVDYNFWHALMAPIPLWFWGILLLVLAIVDIRFVYLVQTNYRSLNKYQKGSARWTTLKEIMEQYPCVPDRAQSVTETFEGKGGIPICHYEDKWYLDTDNTNSLIIGMTRSGKGETTVFSTIDVLSRSSEKPSIVIGDPKLELAAACYDTLCKRGYEVHILNLVEPELSMGYNPLTEIVEAYKRHEQSIAEILCASLCYSIYNPDEAGENSFFDQNAVFGFSALVLAHIEDCLQMDADKNRRRKKIYDNKTKRFRDLDAEKQKEIVHLSSERKQLIAASKTDLKVRQDNRKRIQELDDILTDYELEPFIPTTENEEKITIYSILNTFRELQHLKDPDLEAVTMLDHYFAIRPELDRAKSMYGAIEVAGSDKTKGSIFSTMLSKLMIFAHEDIAKMTAHTTVKMEEIGYGKKPIAIFLGVPDYDKSYYFIATMFLRQMYFTLARKATLTPSGKCTRRVFVEYDEFGNAPKIENFPQMMTVTLGRNIIWDLFVQSYQQLNAVYGEDEKTIRDNMGNEIYIYSKSETAKTFSEMLGNETIIDLNRVGGKLSLSKSFTEQMVERPLMYPQELTDLQTGESVIMRSMHRTNLKGEAFKPHPICNLIETDTSFPYRHTFLADYFPNGNTVRSVTKESCELVDYQNVFDVQTRIKEIEKKLEDGWEPEPFVPAFKKYENTPLHQLAQGLYKMFYEKHKSILSIPWNDFLNCTVNDVFEFLKDNRPGIAKEWKNTINDVMFVIDSDPEQGEAAGITVKQCDKAVEIVQLVHSSVDAETKNAFNLYCDDQILNAPLHVLVTALQNNRKGMDVFKALVEMSGFSLDEKLLTIGQMENKSTLIHFIQKNSTKDERESFPINENLEGVEVQLINQFFEGHEKEEEWNTLVSGVTNCVDSDDSGEEDTNEIIYEESDDENVEDDMEM